MLILGFGLLAGVIHAQALGDTVAQTEAALGPANLSRQSGARTIWLYPDGTRVVFQQGKVVELALSQERREGVVGRNEIDREAGETAVRARAEAASTASVTAPTPLGRASTEHEARGEASSMLIMALGFGLVAVAFVAQIILIVAAFRESALWGLGVLFVPIVPLVFVCMHWQRVKWPAIIALTAGLTGAFLVMHGAR
jgi:hypothetical protein